MLIGFLGIPRCTPGFFEGILRIRGFLGILKGFLGILEGIERISSEFIKGFLGIPRYSLGFFEGCKIYFHIF